MEAQHDAHPPTDDQHLDDLFDESEHASPQRRHDIEDEIVRLHLPLARALARRYQNRGAEDDDLVQVANLALVKAMRAFDHAKGAFAPYATATILGELKRHFRDKCWSVRLPRRLQELQVDITAATSEHWQDHSEAATARDLSEKLGESIGDVREAMGATGCYRAASLDISHRADRQTVGDLMAADPDKDAFGRVDDHLAISDAVEDLDDEQRDLLGMRFFEDMTQQEIADRTGVSQMQVSRRLSRLLGQLRITVGPA